MALNARTMFRLFASAATLGLAACGGTVEEAPADEVATAPAAAPVAITAEEAAAILKVRHDNFEEMGDAFKPIGDTLKSDAPDVALILANAEIISANLQKISGHFPAGTAREDGYDTEALAVIWQQPEEFSAATDNAIAAGAGLVEAAKLVELSEIRTAVGALGNSCKDCHETFRADDK